MEQTTQAVPFDRNGNGIPDWQELSFWKGVLTIGAQVAVLALPRKTLVYKAAVRYLAEQAHQ